MSTEETIKAHIEVLKTIAECIKAAGAMGLPSGHLYAMLMGSMDIDTYNQYIGMLKKAGIIAESNYLLTYIKKAA
jgi:hypothetical protein